MRPALWGCQLLSSVRLASTALVMTLVLILRPTLGVCGVLLGRAHLAKAVQRATVSTHTAECVHLQSIAAAVRLRLCYCIITQAEQIHAAALWGLYLEIQSFISKHTTCMLLLLCRSVRCWVWHPRWLQRPLQVQPLLMRQLLHRHGNSLHGLPRHALQPPRWRHIRQQRDDVLRECDGA
jgi:hypothetical protein